LEIQFGYCPLSLELQTGHIHVTPLPALAEMVSRVERLPEVQRDWVYAPVKFDSSERIFGLPKTHRIVHSNGESAEHVDFLVWCLSFFVGMRLTTTERGFVDCTPLKPNSLTDFLVGHREYGKAMELAEAFWHDNASSPERRKGLVAVIHALFLGQNRRLLQYEEFFHLYTAVDAAFALMSHGKNVGRLKHSERIQWMCEQYGMPIPDWARVSGRGSEVTDLRNPAFHEALFGGEPLGFAIYKGVGSDNVTLEMTGLLCRFLVAVLRRPAKDYVTSPVTTRQMHGLDL